MSTLLTTEDIRYAEEDIAELQAASVKVQRIYGKALGLLDRHYPLGWWRFCTGFTFDELRPFYGQDGEEARTVLQKWIKTNRGWKCVGCEPELPSIRSGTLAGPGLSGDLHSLALQASVWSQFEKTMLLHPILREELFWDSEELADISAYFVPTYWSEAGLRDRIYECRPRSRRGIGIFQQWLPAPSVHFESEKGAVQGKWMTGVYVRRLDFVGLGAYLKPSGGERIYLDPVVGWRH